MKAIVNLSRFRSSHLRDPRPDEFGTWLWETERTKANRGYCSEASHSGMTYAESVSMLDRGVEWFLLP